MAVTVLESVIGGMMGRVYIAPAVESERDGMA
jgi:hypothetical protein